MNNLANKQKPIRMCVVTRKKLPKQEMIRIVINKKQQIFVDWSQKASGSGIYIQAKVDLIKKARKMKIFEKALKNNIPDALYDQIITEIDKDWN